MRVVVLAAFLLSCGGEDLLTSSQESTLRGIPYRPVRSTPTCTQVTAKYSNSCVELINGCFLVIDDLCAGEPIFRMISGNQECGTVETSIEVSEDYNEILGHCVVERRTTTLYEGRSFVALESILYDCDYMPCYALKKSSGQVVRGVTWDL